MKKRNCAWMVMFVSSFVLGQDCTPLWQHDLGTAPIGPKAFMGDTNAAYGEFGFHADNTKVLRLRGRFPHARFMSVESYRTKKNSDYDAILDYQIEPNPGSQNPFRQGVSLDIENRDYSIDVVPNGIDWPNASNTLKLATDSSIVSIWVRYYSPNAGFTISLADLPTLEALDAQTGAPAECPEPYEFTPYTHYPQFLTYIVPHKTYLEFKPFDVGLAGNNAIPTYPQAHSKMELGEVAVLKFKAPSFINTHPGSGEFTNQGEVRYYSMCSINFVKNMGLACLPDHLAHPDKEGFVTLVYGPEGAVESEAVRRGFNFLPDLRVPNQKMVMFAYRNILPSQWFTDNHLFKGDYMPTGMICSEKDFLTDQCNP